MQMPTLADILKARRVISKHLNRTPLLKSPHLSRITGAEIYIKHENHLPTGAFKVRGGLNRLYYLDDEQRKRGVIAASTGNHGQSIAYAAKTYGIKAVIFGPENTIPDKVQAMKNLGAEVVLKRADFDQARECAEELAREKGLVYIHHANEPLLIAGVGTMGLEIMEDLPDVDVIIVPVGGGSTASANCIAAKSINPKIRIIAAQAEMAPSVYLSWKAGQPIETDTPKTFADGLATRVTFELPLLVLTRFLDDFVLLSEDELYTAIALLLEATHNLAEGAGAASTAAALKLKDSLRGKKVVLILSGANLTRENLAKALTYKVPQISEP